MLMVGNEQGLGAMLDGLAAYHGYRSDPALARAITEAGYPVKQQTVNNYRLNKTKKIPPGYLAGFIKALGIKGVQRQQLIDCWLEENPGARELLELMERLPTEDSPGYPS